jgi:ribosomal protein L11 methyltransferase
VPWIELSLRLRENSFPRVESLLELAGAQSISISDAGDTPILEPDAGTTPLWPELTVRAVFADTTDVTAIESLLAPAGVCELSASEISDEQVEAALTSPVSAIEIGPRLKVVPAAELDRTDQRSLGLNMGLAFGTGQHPTTRLCLNWLELHMTAGISVLDYGCGSGILAIAALKLGAASATAVDNEPQALIATRENARANSLEDFLKSGLPAELPETHFDLILANILAETLKGLAADFAGRQPAGGQIVLSGILADQLDDVESEFLQCGYAAFERSLLDGWGLLAGVRRSEYDR